MTDIGVRATVDLVMCGGCIAGVAGRRAPRDRLGPTMAGVPTQEAR
ncbi:hypothetical protein [Nocardia miyunensis]|nr:hypothetical protein [Nocardia miyunensis]